ncbi:hypothetical protein DFH29DRAFT_287522 [Suillus ampliporus]|nr:hypothetical protein DFH29DRAFT_287522 [Suillus ampliporus]
MHHCLRLTEILEVIFHYVFNSVKLVDSSFILYSLPRILPSPYNRDRRSVLHLALTCRAFRDPALNVLYSHLKDIWPFIMRLPDKMIQSGKSSPVHPGPPEWFHPLVPRAACVHILFNPCYNDAAYSFLLASAPKDALIFPKLHSLTWCDSRITSIPTLSLLLPTIDTLSLYVSNTLFRKAIIPYLHTTAPRLKALEFVGEVIMTGDGPSEFESVLLSFPEGLTELSFRCCDISSSLLDIIAPWPRLRWLTLRLGSKSIPIGPLHVPLPFQVLTHLHVSCDDLSLFTSFLRSFQMLGMDSDTCSFGCSNLRTVHINANRCSPASSWFELLSFLTCATLENIILTERCYYQGVQPCPTPSSFDFHPLLAHPASLANLKTLILSPDHSSSIALTELDILALARTCPYLNILDLGARNTPVSLYTLCILVQRCRELREVSLCVDAGLDALGETPSTNGDDNDQVGLQPNTRLIKLDVGESPISSAGPLYPSTAPDLMMSIPRFLHAMAPRLAGIARRGGGWPFRGTYEARWEIVSDAVSAMSKGG